MNERPTQDFSMYPWLGTAVHYFMEHNTFQDQQHELRLRVGEIEGYGEIKGTTDMKYVDPETGQIFVVDWKIVGLKKLKSYRVNGVSEQYRYQAMLYGLGLYLAGEEPDGIAICFIPRDSGNVKDIWVYEEAWNKEMADTALARAQAVYNHVKVHGWKDLVEGDDCWTCRNDW